MKKNKLNYWLAIAAFAVSGCSQNNVGPEEETEFPPILPEETTTIYLQMNAATFKSTPQSRGGQVYDDIDNLRILAFRQNADSYFYIGDVNKSGISYKDSVFTGEAQLPVGTYRFIPAYGISKSIKDNLSISSLSYSTTYSDNLLVSHLENGILPAIFLQNENAAAKDYKLGVNSKETNPKVTLNLSRAVARLDIQFVQGEKKTANSKYTEIAGKVFGENTDLAELTLNFEGLNPSVQLTNGGLVTENVTPVKTLFKVNLNETRTDGNATATIYGQTKADGKNYDYEAITQEDFINGSAHIYGPFLFPYADATTQGCQLTMSLTSTPDKVTGQVYTRTIYIDNVPLSRNKVTLVKVYSGADDIFHTKTAFEIILNKAWDDHQEISGSVE